MRKHFYFLTLFVFDIILKQIALQSSSDFFLIPKLLAFRFFKNPTLAFSISFPQSIIVVFSVLILVGLIIFTYKKPQYFFPASLIFLGALSNLADRIWHGFVIDYFFLYPISYFNLADLLIFTGIILLIIKLSRQK
ncbi:MAG: signal peptidase II [Candidatus Magasanikbacteria bacterium]|nr:signal peptidase II [Candidatus Magasanikbacteria bacterium]